MIMMMMMMMMDYVIGNEIIGSGLETKGSVETTIRSKPV